MTEGFIEEIAGEVQASFRRCLREAYERGFREALASAGHVEPEESPAVSEAGEERQTVDLAMPANPQPLLPDPQVAWTAGSLEEDCDQDDEEARPLGAELRKPIPASTKVATLRRKIVQLFELERFELEIIICRRGDRDRRQLKGSTRLSAYRVEK